MVKIQIFFALYHGGEPKAKNVAWLLVCILFIAALILGGNIMYWNIEKSLSYNALFNFIVGNRGAGKTYGAKKHVIKRFLKCKKQFVYIRRYKEELKKIKKFFDDIKHEFPDVKLEVNGKEFYINGELAGNAMPLSTAKIEKSTAFPEVETIIFDEFILDKGAHHYLSDEVVNFLECYETIARSRDVRVYFLSNAITITNPYFLYFNIKLPYGKTITCNNDILIELVQNKEFIEMKKQTRFGKLINGTEYGNYAIENAFLRDNKTFIEKKSGNCEFFFKFVYKDKIYGVWLNMQEGKIFVSNDYDESYVRTYALTKSDHTPNTLLIHNLKQSRQFKMFVENYQMGNVYFENINIKNVVYEVVKLANIY